MAGKVTRSAKRNRGSVRGGTAAAKEEIITLTYNHDVAKKGEEQEKKE